MSVGREFPFDRFQVSAYCIHSIITGTDVKRTAITNRGSKDRTEEILAFTLITTTCIQLIKNTIFSGNIQVITCQIRGALDIAAGIELPFFRTGLRIQGVDKSVLAANKYRGGGNK